MFEETGLVVEALQPFCRARYGNHTTDVFYATRFGGRVRLNSENTQHAWVATESAYQADLIPPQSAVLRRLA